MFIHEALMATTLPMMKQTVNTVVKASLRRQVKFLWRCSRHPGKDYQLSLITLYYLIYQNETI